jgi:hypothetical protein
MEQEEKKKIQFVIHNFNTSNAPQYVEKASRAGYIFYGEDNLYPDYLISLMNRSAKHNAILKRKAMMIGGNGWDLNGLDGIANQFLANPYNELSLNDIAFRTSYDLELFGAFAVEIIYSKDRSKIAELNYLPANKVRVSDCKKYIYYSDDWSNTRKYTPVKKPIYNPKNPVASQILYVKEYRPGSEIYGQPEYLPCVNYIDLEYSISLFHKNQVDNGFAPSMTITFNNGIPSDDEMRNVIRQLQSDYEGATKAGKVMFLFADGKENAPEITPVQLGDTDERFIELNKEITQGILTGHSVTNPGIFGVNTPGEMGQKSIILESLEMFQSMYINPKQQLVEAVYNKLLRFNGSSSKLVLNKYKLDIEKITEGDGNGL